MLINNIKSTQNLLINYKFFNIFFEIVNKLINYCKGLHLVLY